MLEDVLLLTDKHHKLALEVAILITTHIKDKFIVTIAGESGTGKSEMAHTIGKALKNLDIKAKILHVDNYYKTRPSERTKSRMENGVSSIGLGEYRWEKIDEDINAFMEGKTASLPCIDLITDNVDTLLTDFSNIKVLIIEGLYAITLESDLRLFIDLTYHDTKKAQILRGKELNDDFRLMVLQQEHKNVQQLRKKANYLITRNFDLKPVNPIT